MKILSIIFFLTVADFYRLYRSAQSPDYYLQYTYPEKKGQARFQENSGEVVKLLNFFIYSHWGFKKKREEAGSGGTVESNLNISRQETRVVNPKPSARDHATESKG